MSNHLLYSHPSLSVFSVLLLAITLLLGACSHREYQGPQQPELLEAWTHWHASLHMILSNANNDKKIVGRVDWYQRGAYYDMRVRGPFNITVIRLFNDANGVELKHLREQPVRAANIEELSWSILGHSLPFAFFPYWLKGLPSHETEISDSAQLEGRYQQWMQAGWTVDLHSYRGKLGILLPQHMTVWRGPYSMEMRMRRWRALPK